MSISKGITKQVSKATRAKAIRVLTDNGRNRYMLGKINKIMADKDSLAMFNALCAACFKGEV